MPRHLPACHAHNHFLRLFGTPGVYPPPTAPHLTRATRVCCCSATTAPYAQVLDAVLYRGARTDTGRWRHRLRLSSQTPPWTPHHRRPCLVVMTLPGRRHCCRRVTTFSSFAPHVGRVSSRLSLSCGPRASTRRCASSRACRSPAASCPHSSASSRSGSSSRCSCGRTMLWGLHWPALV